jgi:Pterin 4 alpha carbinolamine dehydratase
MADKEQRTPWLAYATTAAALGVAYWQWSQQQSGSGSGSGSGSSGGKAAEKVGALPEKLQPAVWRAKQEHRIAPGAPEKMSDVDVKAFLAGDDGAGWSKVDGRDAITRTFEFADFKASWAFMNAVADYADEFDHHPEWFNVYNR